MNPVRRPAVAGSVQRSFISPWHCHLRQTVASGGRRMTTEPTS
ncbi:hypothetical protein SLI_4663 [Streptomyces lividans 1326]|uniref:Uncharacterized protein n=1 Tax=Streptomyces lividans 1326 TaxID=1200984 RepID=A0A7U9DXD0_STRLI|nr:hypothetical protein SLI_4663 [Streptomyces lividans 1326]